MTMLLKRCCLRLFITTASLLYYYGGVVLVMFGGKATNRALEDLRSRSELDVFQFIDHVASV